MKRILVSMAVLALAFSVKAQMTEGSVGTQSNGTVHFLYYLPGNYRATGTGHPLIISLAGQGEEGNGSSSSGGLQNLYIGGIPKKIQAGNNMVFSYMGTTDGFVVMAPQLPVGGAWQNFYVDAMISYATAHFNIDLNRIFLTGYSLGGEGVWRYAFGSPNVNQLAGIIPISTRADNNPDYCNLAGAKVAVWAWQGGQDATYGGGTAHNIVTNVNACSNLVVPAYDTIFANYVHGSDFWDNEVYNVTNDVRFPNVFQWMLRINRNLNPATNSAPVPSAKIGGQTTYTVTAPFKYSQFPGLDGTGSYDPDDIIVDYLWEQTAGPAVFLGSTYPETQTIRTQWPTIPALSDPNYQIGIDAGTYNFRLRVKDYLTSKPGHTQFATVTLNVNLPASGHAAPAVEAGGTHTITTATSDRQIGNYFLYNCPGQKCIQGAQWSIVSFPAGSNPQLKDYNSGTSNYSPGEYGATFSNLTVDGVYKFRYAVTNSDGDVGSDILTINRTNAALPVNYAYFNGQNNGAKNELSWATTSEINSERFDVLRSTDGVNFTVAGSVKSIGGAVLTQYTFEDNAAPGTTYYRLSQVDKDGRASLSKTVAVNNRTTGLFIERYPNPVHDNLTITVQGNTNGAMQVVIADMQGKAILQQHWQKDLSVLKKVINVGALQNGVYQMIVTVGQEKQVSSFVKY